MAGHDVSVVDARDGLERSRRRRADRDDSAPLTPGAGNRRSRGGVDLIALLLQAVVLDLLDTHRLKRAVPDVERDLGHLDAAILEGGHQRRVEVQTGGGRRDRPARAREDGLVPVAIVHAIVAPDVRRQRHVTDRIDRGVHGRVIFGPEPNEAPAEESTLEDFAMEGVISVKDDPRPRLQFLPGMHQRLPDHGVSRCRIPTDAGRRASAEQARRKNARVVDDNQIAGEQKPGKRRDVRVREGAGGAAKTQKTRPGAGRRRLLGDQLGRKVEVELADVHGPVDANRVIG